MGYYLADDIYLLCSIFVKIIPNPTTSMLNFAMHKRDAERTLRELSVF
jgi:hypothetical protein